MARTTAPQPAERRSTEFAYERLTEMIIGGEIAAGAPVSQAGLADQLGVSRTPLREAARLLQREGLLVGEPNHRLRVPEVSLEDLDELYSIRITVESLALRVAIPRMTADYIDGLAGELDEIERLAAKGIDADAPHRRFHLGLVAPAGTRYEELGSTLWDHSIRYRSACMEAAPLSPELSELMTEGQHDHRGILEAARSGFPGRAAVILATHYAQTARFLAASIDGDHHLAAIDAALAAAGAN